MHPDPFAPVVHQSGVLEDGQMPRSRRLRQLQDIHDPAHAHLAVEQEVENAQAGVVGQSFKQGSSFSHRIYTNPLFRIFQGFISRKRSHGAREAKGAKMATCDWGGWWVSKLPCKIVKKRLVLDR